MLYFQLSSSCGWIVDVGAVGEMLVGEPQNEVDSKSMVEINQFTVTFLIVVETLRVEIGGLKILGGLRVSQSR